MLREILIYFSASRWKTGVIIEILYYIEKWIDFSRIQFRCIVTERKTTNLRVKIIIIKLIL